MIIKINTHYRPQRRRPGGRFGGDRRRGGGAGPVLRRQSGRAQGASPALSGGAQARRRAPHRLCRSGLGDCLPAQFVPAVPAGVGPGHGGSLFREPCPLLRGPAPGGTGVAAAAPVCGRRLPRAENPPHRHSGQYRPRPLPSRRHGGRPVQMAGVHPRRGGADEGAGGRSALSGQVGCRPPAGRPGGDGHERGGAGLSAPLRVGGL